MFSLDPTTVTFVLLMVVALLLLAWLIKSDPY